MNTLVNRLRGQYQVGPDGVYGTRSFSDFIPPIALEAAGRIEQLEGILFDINSTQDCDYDDEQKILGDIYVRCRKGLLGSKYKV